MHRENQHHPKNYDFAAYFNAHLIHRSIDVTLKDKCQLQARALHRAQQSHHGIDSSPGLDPATEVLFLPAPRL